MQQLIQIPALLLPAECAPVLWGARSGFADRVPSGVPMGPSRFRTRDATGNRKVSEQGISSFIKDRVLRSNFSLENAIQFLNENDLSQVNTINLIHLSSSNSNAVEFQQKVAEATGKLVTVLEKGLSVDFNKTPF